jgi:hypothetical protein
MRLVKELPFGCQELGEKTHRREKGKKRNKYKWNCYGRIQRTRRWLHHKMTLPSKNIMYDT